MPQINIKFNIEELTSLQLGMFAAVCYYKQMVKEVSPQYVDFYQGQLEKAEALYNIAIEKAELSRLWNDDYNHSNEPCHNITHYFDI